MKQIDNLPPGIEIFSNVFSFSEAEFIIDKIESATNNKKNCDISWGIPKMHSPDISSLRRNEAVAISEHSFLNSSCSCGIREVDASLGKIMLKCLEKYVAKYDIGITQDEGFFCVKHGSNHVEFGVVDDNPFVNRIISMHFPLNIDASSEYIKFKNLNFTATLSSPSVIMFPSTFLFSYEKPYHEGLYEIQNFFNNNPSQEFFESVFGNTEVGVTHEIFDQA